MAAPEGPGSPRDGGGNTGVKTIFPVANTGQHTCARLLDVNETTCLPWVATRDGG